MSKFWSGLSVIATFGWFFGFAVTGACANAPTFGYGLTNINSCSGGVFRLENSQPSDRALVVTAGHCAGMGSFEKMPAQGEKFLDVPVDVTMGIGTKNEFENILEAHSGRLLLATMTGTDIAIYEIDKTYADLAAAKVEVLRLSRTPPVPSAGAPVLVPMGYFYQTQQTAFERFVDAVKEGPYLWGRSLVLKRAGEIGPGSSGAPVVLKGTNEILGIVNTGRDENDTHCAVNNPCLVDGKGKTAPVPHTAAIAQPLSGIYDCLTADRKFDLSLPGCKL